MRRWSSSNGLLAARISTRTPRGVPRATSGSCTHSIRPARSSASAATAVGHTQCGELPHLAGEPRARAGHGVGGRAGGVLVDHGRPVVRDVHAQHAQPVGDAAYAQSARRGTARLSVRPRCGAG